MAMFKMERARANPPEGGAWFHVGVSGEKVTALEEHDGDGGGPIGRARGTDLRKLFLDRVRARALEGDEDSQSALAEAFLAEQATLWP